MALTAQATADPVLLKDVHRTTICRCIVGLIAVNPAGRAVFVPSAACERAAVRRQCDTDREIVGCVNVRRLDVVLLGPRRACTREHVDRAAVQRAVVALVMVYTAILSRGADRESVAILRQRY